MDQGDAGKALFTAFGKLETRFSEFERAVGDDVDALFAKFHELKAGIGIKPSQLALDDFSDDCVTLWETVTLMTNSLDSTRLPTLMDQVSMVTQTQMHLQAKLQSLEQGHAELSELLQLLSAEQDQVSRLVQSQATGANNVPASLLQDVQALQLQLSQLSAAGAGTSAQQLLMLQTKLKLVEARLPSDPFLIGGRTFNSKADVALFVEQELSGISFSLFHNPITLLESITDGQSKKTDVMAAMYQASRVGFDEDEATHVHSFKLIIPSLLGATKEGDINDPKYPLPAVKDFGAWSPQDNEGGGGQKAYAGWDGRRLFGSHRVY